MMIYKPSKAAVNNNFRVTMPLNGRTVKYYHSEIMDSSAKSTAPSTTPSTLASTAASTAASTVASVFFTTCAAIALY